MQTASDDSQPVSEEQIIKYLRNHPDFFQQHSHLLSELHLRHESGGAISLVERQVAILRERNMTMRRRMTELMQTAKYNDELFAKTRTLTLELLHVGTWHELNEVLATYVLTDFHADFVCCHVTATALGNLPSRADHSASMSLDHIQGHADEMPHERFVRGAYPICTALRRDELLELFPHAEHEAEGSAVLAPLALDPPGAGCLAIGSRDPGSFAPEMDTLFVTYIAEVLSRVVQRLAP